MARKYKTIYILIEDSRETGLISGDGITGKICYSLEEACATLTKRVWYVEADRRKWIEEMREKHGVVKAWHEYFCTAWLYCPVYKRKRVRID